MIKQEDIDRADVRIRTGRMGLCDEVKRMQRMCGSLIEVLEGYDDFQPGICSSLKEIYLSLLRDSTARVEDEP